MNRLLAVVGVSAMCLSYAAGHPCTSDCHNTKIVTVDQPSWYCQEYLDKMKDQGGQRVDHALDTPTYAVTPTGGTREDQGVTIYRYVGGCTNMCPPENPNPAAANASFNMVYLGTMTQWLCKPGSGGGGV